ncbi:MAG: threonine synthase [Campylobacteraceae bacterium]|jgi:threonine synthase|nr:threonine synthase [Campylobacteraceae bacterium]
MFIETRGNDSNRPKKVEFSYAILNPSASFGGLYTPESLPKIDNSFFEKMRNENYKTLSLNILKLFNIDIEDRVLQEALNLYDNFDNKTTPTLLTKVKSDLFVNELYHGPTRAFKDMALQPFGHILSFLAKKESKKYLILVATSGDTGPATLETFANKENIKVVCLYPDGGTSDVQRLQMVTENAKNLKVIGIKGNFDDAQNALKSLLTDSDFNKMLKDNNINLSAANSVNFGRIIFQIIYHISSYIELVKQNEIEIGEKIYITIPSGNFGNALGAYYAKKMGLPIEKIFIASNINNILTEFINSGVYDISNKKLLNTTSPAMDILISSNVERVLFDKFGSARCKELMESLAKNKKYSLTKDELVLLQEDFEAVFCDDNFALETIKHYVNKEYIMDPHTATCIKAYNELKTKDIPCVICSTAEWTKFAPTMLNAIRNDDKKYSDKEALEEISKTLNAKIPECISSLFSKKIVHDVVIEKSDIKKEISSFIKGNQ